MTRAIAGRSPLATRARRVLVNPVVPGAVVGEGVEDVPHLGPWEAIAPLPARLVGVGRPFVIGDGMRIVIVGYDGMALVSMVSEYDPGTDTFSDLGDAPIILGGNPWNAYDETTGFAIVGWLLAPGLGGTADVLSYDLAGDTWTTGLTNPAIPRYNCIAGASGGFVYIASGQKNSDATVTTTGEKYDIGGDSWSSIASIPTLSGFGFLSWNTAVDLGGDLYCAYSQTADFIVYDTSGNSWSNPGGPFGASLGMVRVANGTMATGQRFHSSSWHDDCAVFRPSDMVEGTADDAPFVGPAIVASSGNDIFVWDITGTQGARAPVNEH